MRGASDVSDDDDDDTPALDANSIEQIKEVLAESAHREKTPAEMRIKSFVAEQAKRLSADGIKLSNPTEAGVLYATITHAICRSRQLHPFLYPPKLYSAMAATALQLHSAVVRSDTFHRMALDCSNDAPALAAYCKKASVVLRKNVVECIDEFEPYLRAMEQPADINLNFGLH
jgi:hypothetical protein